MKVPYVWRVAQDWAEERRARKALKPLLQFLNGKSIAIVGNATSLLSHSYGPLIDGHEVVTRMNKGFPISPVAQGRRFDLWGFSNYRILAKTPKNLVCPRLIWMSPTYRERADRELSSRQAECFFYPLKDWSALHERLGARPSVGAMTIDLISRSKPRQVTIIGFDFNRTKSFYENRTTPSPHDFATESRYVLGMVERLSWRFIAT